MRLRHLFGRTHLPSTHTPHLPTGHWTHSVGQAIFHSAIWHGTGYVMHDVGSWLTSVGWNDLLITAVLTTVIAGMGLLLQRRNA